MATIPEQNPNGNVGRRAFVKGSVAAAVAAAVGGTAFSIAKPLAIIKPSTAREINYIASFKVAGPAPRGIGWLPLRINPEGELEGVPTWVEDQVAAGEFGETDLGPTLDWYKYCGHEGAPGLAYRTEEKDGKLVRTPTYEGDNKLRYFVTEDKILQGFNPWYRPFLDQPMRADQFKENFTGTPGGPDALDSGAGGNWRSEGQTGVNILSVIVIKTDPKLWENTDAVFAKALAGKGNVAAAVAKNIIDAQGFVAFVSFCTHFCCIPGWKEDKSARSSKGIPEVGDGTSWDLIFCTCHLSRYNPINLTLSKFILEEKETDEAAGAGGAAGGGH